MIEISRELIFTKTRDQEFCMKFLQYFKTKKKHTLWLIVDLISLIFLHLRHIIF